MKMKFPGDPNFLIIGLMYCILMKLNVDTNEWVATMDSVFSAALMLMYMLTIFRKETKNEKNAAQA